METPIYKKLNAIKEYCLKKGYVTIDRLMYDDSDEVFLVYSQIKKIENGETIDIYSTRPHIISINESYKLGNLSNIRLEQYNKLINYYNLKNKWK